MPYGIVDHDHRWVSAEENCVHGLRLVRTYRAVRCELSEFERTKVFTFDTGGLTGKANDSTCLFATNVRCNPATQYVRGMLICKVRAVDVKKIPTICNVAAHLVRASLKRVIVKLLDTGQKIGACGVEYR